MRNFAYDDGIIIGISKQISEQISENKRFAVDSMKCVILYYCRILSADDDSFFRVNKVRMGAFMEYFCD